MLYNIYLNPSFLKLYVKLFRTKHLCIQKISDRKVVWQNCRNIRGNYVNPQCNIFYRHDYTQLDIFENAKKSLTLICLPCQENTQRNVFVLHTNEREMQKSVCVQAHTKPNTHNTSLTFYLTITATSCRTELALTYLPNLSSL